MNVAYLSLLLVFSFACKSPSQENGMDMHDSIKGNYQSDLELLTAPDTSTSIDTPDSGLFDTSAPQNLPLASKGFIAQECEKCDIKKVAAISEQGERLTSQSIYDFLCTFDESCSSNIEYSEFSNRVLYDLLRKYPESISEILSTAPNLNADLIYEQIANPLLDYEYGGIIDVIRELEGNEDVKKQIIEALNKALQGQ